MNFNMSQIWGHDGRLAIAGVLKNQPAQAVHNLYTGRAQGGDRGVDVGLPVLKDPCCAEFKE